MLTVQPRDFKVFVPLCPHLTFNTQGYDPSRYGFFVTSQTSGRQAGMSSQPAYRRWQAGTMRDPSLALGSFRSGSGFLYW